MNHYLLNNFSHSSRLDGRSALLYQSLGWSYCSSWWSFISRLIETSTHSKHTLTVLTKQLEPKI